MTPEDVVKVTAVTRELTSAARRARRLFLRLYPPGAAVRFKPASGGKPMAGVVWGWGGLDSTGCPTVRLTVDWRWKGEEMPAFVRASQILEVTPKTGDT
jgi:hypothetical protein